MKKFLFFIIYKYIVFSLSTNFISFISSRRTIIIYIAHIKHKTHTRTYIYRFYNVEVDESISISHFFLYISLHSTIDGLNYNDYYYYDYY
jgi:hypothetical protein